MQHQPVIHWVRCLIHEFRHLIRWFQQFLECRRDSESLALGLLPVHAF
jgi:hypothetical protein